VPPEEVFAVVTEEVGRLLSVEYAGLNRYEPDGTTSTMLAVWSRTGGPLPPPGRPQILGGRNINTIVFETGRAARIDSYADASGPLGQTAREMGIGSGVGTPIVVEGRLWGAMTIYSTPDHPLPPDTEARLASFTELVATAIANAESRAGLARLAEEQAALRRVATLVARRTLPEGVFATVLDEVGQLLRVDMASICRYESDGTISFVASWGRAQEHFPAGSRQMLGGNNLGTIILKTGRSARIDNYADSSSGPIGVTASQAGINSSLAAPIMVEGRLWGLIAAGSNLKQPLPADTEARVASFTELVATAIANAESRAELKASRARIVAAADEARRRLERDLHDGIQQRLVSLLLQMRGVEAAVPPQLGELDRDLSRVAEGLASVFDELREISRGIHPAVLSQGGLGPALRSLRRRSAVPVVLDLNADRRLPERVEVAAYYVVSEALTNAAKHAHASVVKVELHAHDAILQLAIRDDGIGGADPSRGSGLLGLSDRIEALGGTLEVTSPTGGGTTLLIELPVEG
jgi:signal transduction histidine kinase